MFEMDELFLGYYSEYDGDLISLWQLDFKVDSLFLASI